MTDTAARANKRDSHTIIFKNREHEKFYKEYLQKCRYQDVYHRALVYCLGTDRDTREHVDSIYNFKSGCVRTECLHEGWQTSGSVRIVRMAFNLYCNGKGGIKLQQRINRKRFVRYKEGAEMYSMCQSKFEKMAKEAKAIYKLDKLVLVNCDIFEAYLEGFHLSE